MSSYPNNQSVKPKEFNFSERKRRVEPYYIVLKKAVSEPIEICQCDLIGNVRKVKHETHNIWFYRNSGINEGVFVVLLLAADVETALKNAITLRDETIKKGEWQRVWERHRDLLVNIGLKLCKKQ